jgi:carboxyl-terminal processing protease
VGSELGHLLGAKFDESLPSSGVSVSLGEEQLFHVNGTPREEFYPAIYVSPAERNGARDPAFEAILRYEATMQTAMPQ